MLISHKFLVGFSCWVQIYTWAWISSSRQWTLGGAGAIQPGPAGNTLQVRHLPALPSKLVLFNSNLIHAIQSFLPYLRAIRTTATKSFKPSLCDQNNPKSMPL